MMGLYRFQVDKTAFSELFGIEIKDVLGKFVSMLKISGIIRESRDRYTVTRKGKYVISLMTKTMMISFPGRYYEECLKNPWPGDFEM
jgi:coproporphyrinogen III oxidase-like Fe-S oxidoreductase